MEQMLLAYGPHKETISNTMMQDKNRKANVRWPNGDKDLF